MPSPSPSPSLAPSSLVPPLSVAKTVSCLRVVFCLTLFPRLFHFRLAREGGEQREARETRRPARCEVGIDRSARSRVRRGRGVLALRSRARGAFSLNPIKWKPMGTARSSSRTRLRSMRKTRTERSSIGVSERRRSTEGRHVPPPPRPPLPIPALPARRREEEVSPWWWCWARFLAQLKEPDLP